VVFTVSGAIPADRLQVAVSAADESLLPPSAFTLAHAGGGDWRLTIAPPASRSGTTTVQVRVSDGSVSTTATFVVTVAGVGTQPTAPSNLVATASGSGIVLTWIAPATAAPLRYAIAGGANAGTSTLPVIVTAGPETSYTIPMVPPGTYYFRVYALLANAVSAASNEASVTASGSTIASGPPSAARATGSDYDITVSWQPPAGPAPTIYYVEFGSAPGANDLAIVTAVATNHTRRVPAGTYYMRVRAVSGGTISAPSNDVAIAVPQTSCAAAPGVPLLLPPSTTSGLVTFGWLPAAGADRYRLDVTSASGPVATLNSPGAGTTAAWPAAAGAYRVVVSAANACGTGAPSNQVSFTVP
jgi:hypothetical protein